MRTNHPTMSASGRVALEVERERNEKMMNDEERAGLSPADDYRIKDARENVSASFLKRPVGR